jgi:hypothetical protein
MQMLDEGVPGADQTIRAMTYVCRWGKAAQNPRSHRPHSGLRCAQPEHRLQRTIQ